MKHYTRNTAGTSCRCCSLRHLSRLLCIVSTLALLQVLVFIFHNSTDRPTRHEHNNNPDLLADIDSHDESHDSQPVSHSTGLLRTSSRTHWQLSSGQSLRRSKARKQISYDLISSLEMCFMNCSSNLSMTSVVTSSMTHKRQSNTKCIEEPKVFDQEVVYRSIKKGVICLIEGTQRVSHGRCHCKGGWLGESCSIPSVVTNSNYPREYGVKVRDQPSRIVYAFPFSHEFDLLEMRVEEYEDVVNVYVIVESNYTASGLSKPRLLSDRLKGTDYLRRYRSKIVVVELDWFPSDAYTDGWIADELLRTFIVSGGLTQLRGIREDDVFVLTDADEIPSRSALLFLKLHYGYPEPIGFRLRHNVFSSRWISPHNPVSNIFGACSFGMLRHVFYGNPYYLRRATRHLASNTEALENFRHNRRGRVAEWSFGGDGEGMQAGVHCSWCFDVAGILTKMKSAHVSDVPRWGDSKQYANKEYISYLVENGLWFDNKTKLLSAASKLDQH